MGGTFFITVFIVVSCVSCIMLLWAIYRYNSKTIAARDNVDDLEASNANAHLEVRKVQNTIGGEVLSTYVRAEEVEKATFKFQGQIKVVGNEVDSMYKDTAALLKALATYDVSKADFAPIQKDLSDMASRVRAQQSETESLLRDIKASQPVLRARAKVWSNDVFNSLTSVFIYYTMLQDLQKTVNATLELLSNLAEANTTLQSQEARFRNYNPADYQDMAITILSNKDTILPKANTLSSNYAAKQTFATFETMFNKDITSLSDAVTATREVMRTKNVDMDLVSRLSDTIVGLRNQLQTIDKISSSIGKLPTMEKNIGDINVAALASDLELLQKVPKLQVLLGDVNIAAYSSQIGDVALIDGLVDQVGDANISGLADTINNVKDISFIEQQVQDLNTGSTLTKQRLLAFTSRTNTYISSVNNVVNAGDGSITAAKQMCVDDFCMTSADFGKMKELARGTPPVPPPVPPPPPPPPPPVVNRLDIQVEEVNGANNTTNASYFWVYNTTDSWERFRYWTQVGRTFKIISPIGTETVTIRAIANPRIGNSQHAQISISPEIQMRPFSMTSFLFDGTIGTPKGSDPPPPPQTQIVAKIEEVNGGNSVTNASHFWVYLTEISSWEHFRVGRTFNITSPISTEKSTIMSVDNPRAGNSQQVQITISPPIQMRPYSMTTFQFDNIIANAPPQAPIEVKGPVNVNINASASGTLPLIAVPNEVYGWKTVKLVFSWRFDFPSNPNIAFNRVTLFSQNGSTLTTTESQFFGYPVWEGKLEWSGPPSSISGGSVKAMYFWGGMGGTWKDSTMTYYKID